MTTVGNTRRMAEAWRVGLPILVFGLCAVWRVAASEAQGSPSKPTRPPESGWKLPPNAADEKNPLPDNDATIAAGKKIFNSKCQRCHGPQGKGDGPDADKKHREHMDLTNPARATDNPDGVIFYRVWNGRTSPKMPTFSEQLSKEQVWAVVTYVQTLRGK